MISRDALVVHRLASTVAEFGSDPRDAVGAVRFPVNLAYPGGELRGGCRRAALAAAMRRQ